MKKVHVHQFDRRVVFEICKDRFGIPGEQCQLGRKHLRFDLFWRCTSGQSSLSGCFCGRFANLVKGFRLIVPIEGLEDQCAGEFRPSRRDEA